MGARWSVQNAPASVTSETNKLTDRHPTRALHVPPALHCSETLRFTVCETMRFTVVKLYRSLYVKPCASL